MIDPITLNARKPKDDEYGHAMLNRMNERHKPLYKWGLEHISIDSAKDILDIGYGGGQNIRNMHQLVPDAKICGIDYSEASYKKCSELNHEEINNGKLELKIGSAQELPYEKESFDLVTAFETVYYWPEIDTCFKNVYNVLKEKGVFLICNEDCSSDGIEDIAKTLEMNFYNVEALETLLKKAGFKTVHTYLHKKGKWVCAVGIK